MKTYNWHRSRNARNVALRLSNEESLYKYIVDFAKANKDKKQSNVVNRIIDTIWLLWDKTPDGAIYNRLSMKLAINWLLED